MSTPRGAQRAWVLQLLQRELTDPTSDAGQHLPAFQQTAAELLQGALARFGGAILADEVGLGKTHVALALIAAQPRAAVFAPAALRPMWRRALEAEGLLHTTTLASHTALSRADSPHDLLPDPVDLIVVDEAHAFTRPDTLRYRNLAFLALQAPVLLLSATPVGIDPRDLVALLRIFCPRGSLTPLLGAPLEEAVAAGADLTPILRHVLVRRSRAFIQRLHPRGLRFTSPDGDPLRLTFPQRHRVLLRSDLTAQWPDLLDALLAEIEALDEAVTQAPAPLLRALLLARLESSPHALDASLSRLEAFLRRRLDAARQGVDLDRRAWRDLFGQLSAEDDRQTLLPCFWEDRPSPPPTGPDRLCAQLERVLRLRDLLRPVLQAPPATAALLTFLADLPPDEPALIFTRYTDTAEHLLRAIGDAWPAAGVGLLHGGGARLAGAAREVRRDDLLDRFAHPPEHPAQRLRFLVATDVLAEGANLQACPNVVSFDMPWNPRRLVQRFGRVDRLGPPGRSVRLALSLPDRDLDRLLELQLRVADRLAAAQHLLRDDPDPLVPHPDDLRWLKRTLERDDDPLEAALHALLPPSSEQHPHRDLLALLRDPPPPLPDPPPHGWTLSATPRLSPGTLLLLNIEGDPEPLRYAFIHDRTLAVESRRDQVYPRLSILLRRAATPALQPPAAHLRAGITWALQIANQLRAAPAPPLPPASAANKLLRQLAALPPPPPHAAETLAQQERLMDLLRHPLPTAVALALQADLDAARSLEGTIQHLLDNAPTRAPLPEHPSVQLVGFVCFKINI